MEVLRYTFQSPYPSPVQFGRPDPSTKKEEGTREETAQLLQSSNETLKEAQQLQENLKKEVNPTLNSLDLYA